MKNRVLPLMACMLIAPSLQAENSWQDATKKLVKTAVLGASAAIVGALVHDGVRSNDDEALGAGLCLALPTVFLSGMLSDRDKEMAWIKLVGASLLARAGLRNVKDRKGVALLCLVPALAISCVGGKT